MKWQEFASIVAKYPNDASLQYIYKENPGQLELGYWKKHFELEFFKTWAPPGSIVFDFGCGCGGLDMQLAQVGYVVYGYDNSQGCIEIAKAQAVSHALTAHFYDTFPEWLEYDRAWICHCLEHIPTEGFEATFKMFKPVPTLITVPFARGYDSPFHVQHWFSEDDLATSLSPVCDIHWTRIDATHSVIRAEVVPYGYGEKIV